MAIFPAFRKAILENSSNLFTKRKNCDTIIAPNKKRIMILRRAPYFCRGLYAFLNFLHKLVNNGKNVDSANLCIGIKMSNYCKITEQDAQNVKDKDFFEGMSDEKLELFRRALSDAMDSKICDIEEKIKDMEIPPPSKRHKIRMNRLFRECVGGSFLPFPEEDNLY